jgi:hypothetical protein
MADSVTDHNALQVACVSRGSFERGLAVEPG